MFLLYCRLRIALDLLNKALHKKGKYKRDCVLLALWHLISWAAGRETIPQPNATNTNDDILHYCDLCLKPRRAKERYAHTDCLDLCKKCSREYCKKQLEEEEKDKQRQRFKQIDNESDRVHKELAKLKR